MNNFETKLPLFPYQKEGASFIFDVGSGLLGHEMGLGKGLMALAVCERAEAGAVLIFCPSAIKWQWYEEIKKFMGDNQSIVVIEGNKIERTHLWRKAHQFYIVNYELLLRDFELMNLRVWDVIIADEATKISNARAKQSRMIKKLRATRRIALTGTPISNRANEVWNIIDWTNPGVLGNYWAFIQRYCVKNQWGGIFGYQNLEELKSRLRPYMIRRMKVDVLPELPEKITTNVPFELSPEEKNLYGKIKKEILFEIERNDISKMENPMTIQYTLVKMLRLRQLTDSMELLGHNKQSSKLEVLKELLVECIQQEKKVIVFTQFAEMADILARELAEYQPLVISGKIKEEYKDVVNRFNTDQNNRILIMTSAGQFGLNIQCASVIFHYDFEWSLGKMEQRDGRAHRYGQKDTVLVYNLIAKGTLDEYVQKVLYAKREIADRILMDDIKAMLHYGE